MILLLLLVGPWPLHDGGLATELRLHPILNVLECLVLNGKYVFPSCNILQIVGCGIDANSNLLEDEGNMVRALDDTAAAAAIVATATQSMSLECMCFSLLTRMVWSCREKTRK